MMFFITSFFSISPLYVKWLLPYIIKNNSSEGLLKQLNQSRANPGPMLWKNCVNYSFMLSI